MAALPILACLLAACGGSASPSAGTETVTIFAAASLTDVMADLEPAYEAEHPAVDLIFSFDASSALRAQIAEGAPAALLLSADTSNAQALADAGLAAGDPQPFTRNRLTIAVPTEGGAGIATWQEMAGSGIRVVAAGEEVPIQRYAEEAIDKLAGLPDAPDGFAAAVRANVVSREDNVRAILAKLELGEGDAGFVYVTDARSSDGVRAIEIPAEAAVAVTYAGVVVDGATDQEAAAGFQAWLLEDMAQAALRDAGFSALE